MLNVIVLNDSLVFVKNRYQAFILSVKVCNEVWSKYHKLYSLQVELNSVYLKSRLVDRRQNNKEVKWKGCSKLGESAIFFNVYCFLMLRTSTWFYTYSCITFPNLRINFWLILKWQSLHTINTMSSSKVKRKGVYKCING